MKSFRFVGDHADELDGGRPVGPGDEVKLDEKALSQPIAARLIEEEKLLPIGKPKTGGGGSE